ncbi:hypothetical protein BJF87_10900 [Gordonia sp. CNJ-863]|uniref:Uncharacterized protein n=1 Tax=Gordonia alkanivorans CGMCC 6845 TaxID=1423140 RepID=W9DFM7_9ACTN|nr:MULTISPECIES: hypothetical protein [Gordonia]ETA05226.1 hypothetical protein V525_19985 [Gordonia alkanivorans CGMCC 6845]MDH3049775.1 hypothetical protein [Gordonia alkanivorans]MDJ0009552.1 hypothetical protein [Gordonia alkanivorans]MDJ0028193.1 hypothetical protein [Gordonia alkanivorans]MDJ0099401.1 hypothetical protein [Gordonia alkanivorans]
MLGTGEARPGRSGHRGVRASMTVGMALGGIMLSACTSTVGGTGVAAPGEVAIYRSEVSASAAAQVRTEGVELCRESMSSMVVMVRGYNTFIKRLNTTHSYPEVGDLADKARASLIAGADQIRPKITDTSPPEIATPARTFLDTTARLENAIRKEQRTELNPVSGQWTRDKARLLEVCGQYTPVPAASSATPRSSVTTTPAPTSPGR